MVKNQLFLFFLAMMFLSLSIKATADNSRKLLIKISQPFSAFSMMTTDKVHLDALQIKGVNLVKILHQTKRSSVSRIGTQTLLNSPCYFMVSVHSTANITEVIQQLKQVSGVDYVEEDKPILTCELFSTNDPMPIEAALTTQINRINLNGNYANLSEMIIAVIDTGVEIDHPDLAENIYTNKQEISNNGIDDDTNGFIDDSHGYNFQSYFETGGNANVTDENGHGTHVAGIIGAVANNGIGIAGINYRAKILPVKFLDANGSGSQGDGAMAIYYAVDRGADIINCSWGYFEGTQTLADAVQYALDNGVVVVAAAGNYNWNKPQYPASYPGVIAVAALDNRDKKAYFSNYGDYISIAAPGIGITSTFIHHQYKTLSGTSQAAPMVSGLAALTKATYLLKSPQDIALKLFRGAQDILVPLESSITFKGWDPYTGYGKIDLAHTLDQGNTTDDQNTTAIKQLLNYPNPVRKTDLQTTFGYYMDFMGDVSIKIYTLNGTLINEIRCSRGTPGGMNTYNKVPYMLTDQSGKDLTNGTYLYVVSAVFNDGSSAKQKGKLVVLR